MIEAKDLLCVGRLAGEDTIEMLRPVALVEANGKPELWVLANGAIRSTAELQRSGWELLVGHVSQKRELLAAFEDHDEELSPEQQERAEVIELANQMAAIYGEQAIANLLFPYPGRTLETLPRADLATVLNRLKELEGRAFGVRS